MTTDSKAISAEQIERICSRQFDARKFASLCNSIIWSAAGRKDMTLPAFTERVNVKDGGIDAEWDIEIPAGDKQSAMLKSGWNVYQFKQRDIFAQGRAITLNNL